MKKASFLSKKVDMDSERDDPMVSVPMEEMEHFLKDVLQTLPASRIKRQPFYFILGFITGFLILCIGMFFVYTSAYYVKHELLQSTSSSTCYRP